ncbi:hypothetical protein E2C01_047818 [Portunus trituberculatus]|uniref:Uncharacterized protein n=1 Tax=Portunus trituberculatus TaxID=210409 RepID=A0A5B7G8W2_PORTR|nr:hypothetical protein [Portunus trituberculatus]
MRRSAPPRPVSPHPPRCSIITSCGARRDGLGLTASPAAAAASLRGEHSYLPVLLSADAPRGTCVPAAGVRGGWRGSFHPPET